MGPGHTCSDIVRTFDAPVAEMDTFVRYSIYLVIFKSQKGSIEALSFLITHRLPNITP